MVAPPSLDKAMRFEVVPFELDRSIMEELQQRLELLDQKKLQAKQLNKDYLRKYLQVRNQSSKKVEHHNDDDDDDATNKKQKHMNYTIKQCQEWNEKKMMKNSNKLNMSTYSNYNKLAELSYYKNLKMTIDDNKSNDTNPLDILLNLVKTQNLRRLSKRRRNELSDSFINDKNKQFNMKLNREQIRSKTDQNE
jgi:pre-mRNA-splicing factor SYF2